MAMVASSDHEDSINVSVFEQSSSESQEPRALSPLAHDHFSNTSEERILNHDTEDEYYSNLHLKKRCSSSRSSISSFPASISQAIPFTDIEDAVLRTPSHSHPFSNAKHSPINKTPSRNYLSAFRHPNSVRALQLDSEYADSDVHSISQSARHRRSHRTSYFAPRSPGSAHSSPTKRSSRPATPQPQRSQSKLKKEFPLVLLHCTLLSPAAAARGSLIAEEVLEAILPEAYRKRWRVLQDKVVKNVEVKQRGVLIAHPREDYDLLEERLLEALELERPRIRRGHYIGAGGDSDSGFESSSQNGTDEGSDAEEQTGQNKKERCEDCGRSVSCKTEQDRKWEIKVFAANGLMRSGAWSAAWEQMEKVDVEVAVWMPEDVRIEVDERLKALQANEEAERAAKELIDSPRAQRTRRNTARLRHDQRMREIYGELERPRTPEIDGLTDRRESAILNSEELLDAKIQHDPPEPVFVHSEFQQDERSETPLQPDFLTFMRHHFNAIVNDQRNLAIVLLSILVLFFSVQNVGLSNSVSPPAKPDIMQEQSTLKPVMAQQVFTITEAHPVSYVTTTVFATHSQSPIAAQPDKPQEEYEQNLRMEDRTSIREPSSKNVMVESALLEKRQDLSNAMPHPEPVLPSMDAPVLSEVEEPDYLSAPAVGSGPTESGEETGRGLADRTQQAEDEKAEDEKEIEGPDDTFDTSTNVFADSAPATGHPFRALDHSSDQASTDDFDSISSEEIFPSKFDDVPDHPGSNSGELNIEHESDIADAGESPDKDWTETGVLFKAIPAPQSPTQNPPARIFSDICLEAEWYD